MISLKYIPLTFITSNDEIIRQIKNTVVFSHFFETCKETTFSNYIETTQYGFTASALENGSHKMLRITDIHHSKVNWESVPFCDCSDDEKYLLKDHDILIARTGGTTGKSFFVENPPSNAVFASYLIRIRLKKDVNIEFINAFLNSYCFWSQIVEMKAGSAQPNVNAEKLKTLTIPECDLKTQEKAVGLIKEENSSDSIRERIDEVESVFWNSNQISTELNHQLALVKELRQAYLREAMQGKLVPQDTTDEPADSLLEKIKAEKEKLIAEKKIKKGKPLPEINPEEIPFEIPNNWTWCRLGEIAKNVEYGTSQKADLNSENVPVLRMNNIFEGKVILKSLKYVKATIKDLPQLYLKNNDLLFNRTNSYELVGKSGVFKGDDDSATFASYLIRIQFMNLLSVDFINHYINSVQCREIQIEPNIIQQNGQANFNGTKLQNIITPLPPLSEQKRIVEKLEKLMNFCDELESTIRESKGQSESLLQVALKEALEAKG